jgi:hypothetical protein
MLRRLFQGRREKGEGKGRREKGEGRKEKGKRYSHTPPAMRNGINSGRGALAGANATATIACDSEDGTPH